MTARLYLFLSTIWLAACSRPTQIRIVRKDIIETVYASGKIIASDEYSLFAFSSGTIRKKLVKDGDTVGKGQLLYVVEHQAAEKKYEAAKTSYRHSEINISENSPLLTDLRLAVQNAEIKLNNDSLTYFRWKNLWDSGIGTRSNLDNANMNYRMSINFKNSSVEKFRSALNDAELAMSNAGSQLQSSREEVNDFFISSDRDGVVYQTLKEAGEGVRFGEPVALIGGAGGRVIRLAVDQEDISKVKIGQQIVLRTDLTGDSIFHNGNTILAVTHDRDFAARSDRIIEMVDGAIAVRGNL